MATNGNIKTNTLYDSYFWVNWSLSSQDVVANKSKIAWSCGVYCGHSFYLNAIKMSAVSINGVQVYGGGTYSNFAPGNHTIANGTLEIPHNTDGTKTFSISSFTGWLYSSYNYSSNGGSYSLTTIPRQATITAAYDFTDQENPRITFNNPGGFRLDVWLEPNPVSDHLCVRENIPNTGSYTWSLTAAERDALRNKCPGNDCTIRLGLYTRIGSATYSDYKDKKFTVTENTATKPVASVSATLNNELLPSKFAGMWIQGKSKANVSLSTEGKYGAKITNRWVNLDGKRYTSFPFTSDVIQRSGPVWVDGYATDSRGFTNADSQRIDVTAYSKPSVESATCYRSDGNGKKTGGSTSIWIKAKRSYNTVNGKNTCALQWRWKIGSEVWNDTKHPWSDLISKTNTTTAWYDALVPGNFDTTKAYTVQVRSIDDIGEYHTITFDIPTEDVALHLGKGGKNVTVGGYCDYSEERTFRSAWDATFDKGINGVYIRTVDVSNGKEIRLQTEFQNWDANGTSRQSFLVFGSANATLVHGICVVHNSGVIRANSITNCEASCEDVGGVVKLTLSVISWDRFTILSASPFTILQ